MSEERKEDQEDKTAEKKEPDNLKPVVAINILQTGQVLFNQQICPNVVDALELLRVAHDRLGRQVLAGEIVATIKKGLSNNKARHLSRIIKP